MAHVDLPTAEDCTVEPLTVDEVLWYVTDPFSATESIDIYHPAPEPTMYLEPTSLPGFTSAIPTDEPTGATPQPTLTTEPYFEPGFANTDQLSAVAATQRVWMACVLADSYFQKWALEDPGFVRQQVLEALPVLTGEDEARIILEELEANGPSSRYDIEGLFYSFSVLQYPGMGGIQLVDQTPDNSWASTADNVAVGYVRYNTAGEAIDISDVFQGRGLDGDHGSGFLGYGAGCSDFQFARNIARDTWLVTSVPACG